MLHQAVNEFILGLGVKEVNADKRRKISALALHDKEWTHIRLFCNILQVCVYSIYVRRLLIVDAPLTGDSTQTMPNRHSLQHRHRPYRTCSLPWRNYTHHGRRPLRRPATSLSFQHSLLGWRSSTLITSAVQSWTRTLWPWVAYFSPHVRYSLILVSQFSTLLRRCLISASTGPRT